MNRALLIIAVGLLALIWLELGGAERLSGMADDAVRSMRNIGKVEEGPAPAPPGYRGGGILDLHADETAKALPRWVAPPASSASR
jgi:hypothetical protein